MQNALIKHEKKNFKKINRKYKHKVQVKNGSFMKNIAKMEKDFLTKK